MEPGIVYFDDDGHVVEKGKATQCRIIGEDDDGESFEVYAFIGPPEDAGEPGEYDPNEELTLTLPEEASA